jgi:hypothetical protein
MAPAAGSRGNGAGMIGRVYPKAVVRPSAVMASVYVPSGDPNFLFTDIA